MTAYHTREALVIEAKFLREDLPYFTELLGEVVSQTKKSDVACLKWGPGEFWFAGPCHGGNANDRQP